MVKIAICYYGLLRTLNLNYKSHFEKIFDIFTKNNITYDIFMHTWHTNNQYVWGNKIDKEINYEDCKLINPYKLKIDSQDDFLKNLKFDDYFYNDVYTNIGHTPEGEWLPELVRNHLCALESLKRVYNLINLENTTYDYILVIRPDCIINDEFPIKKILEIHNSNNTNISIPNFEHNEGYNDRFAFIDFKHSKIYCKRIDYLKEFRKNNGRIVSEKYTKFICDNLYQVNFIDNFTFDLVRP